MKKTIIMVIICTASFLLADTNYHFFADLANDVKVKSFGPNNRTYPSHLVRRKGDGTTQTIYDIIVTKPQYDAGWAALNPAVKTAAKTAAQDDMKDIDKKIDKLMKAAVLVLLAYINDNRTDPNTIKASITKAQFKTAIKTKYDILP